MSSAGGVPPVGKAAVVILPDLTGFKAKLEAEVNASIASLKIKPVTIPVVAVSTGGSGGRAASAAASAAALEAGASSARAARGVSALSTESNALRGALIGLSHITPVTVFGLGLYGTAALAAGLAIKSAINSTADFEHQLNVFQATTGATADEMRQVSDEAKRLGADLTLPSTSAGDAARAMTELGKAGLTVRDTLASARGVLQLAAAANLDVGTSATFVATELNAFNLAGTEATHVADLLAGASIAAQGEIADFGNAFQQVSAVANAADVSLETTTGALTELARAGLRGADAGTSLRTFLLRLTPTTKQAAEFQKALGIELDKNATIGEQLPELINQYQKALQGLSPVLRQQALTQIFGQDAIRAATILIDGGTQALDRYTAAADKQGAASQLAEANAKGLSGALNGLKSNADTLGITVGEFVKGPLTGLVTSLSEGVSDLTQLVDGLDRLAQKVKSLKLPPINLPIHISLPGGGIKIPGTKTSIGDFLGSDSIGKSVVDFLDLKNPLSVTPPGRVKQIADFLAKQINARNADIRDKLRAAVTAATPPEELFPPFVPEKAIGGRNFSATDLGLSKGPFTPAALAAAAKRAKALQALQEKNVNQTKIKPPNALLNEQLDAQIRGDLQAELAADQKIEKWLEGKKARAIKNTAQYTAINQALASAHQATQSVLNEIQQQQVVIPKSLRIASVQAQLSDDLQQELSVDRQIETYLRGKLIRAQKQHKDTEGILNALKQAHQDTQGTLKQIQSERQQAQQTAANNLRTALGNQEARLSLRAQDANNVGPAERALIAFYRRQSQNSKLVESERLAYQSKFKTEQKNFTAAIAAAAKSEIDRRKALLDLAIQEAEITPGFEDNKKAINNEIRFLRGLRDKTKEFSKEWIDYQSQIDSLKQRLKDGTDSGGPSLAGLFAEAGKEFKDFASNVTSSVLSPGGVRASFAAAISVQNQNLSKGEALQIQQAATTNDLLGQILVVVKRNPAATQPSGKTVTSPNAPLYSEGFATAAHARDFTNIGGR